MNVEVIHNKNIIVRVSGSIESPEISKLRAAVENAFDISPRGFVVDLSAVDHISSTGISTLIFAYRKIYAVGGKLIVIAVHSDVRKALKIMRLDALPGLFIYDDISVAESMLEAA